MPKKVTKEIADFIYDDYDALKIYGVKPREALETIKSDVLDKFSVECCLGTIQHYAHQTFEKIRESERRFNQSKKGKDSVRRFWQSEKGKDYRIIYRQSEKYKEYIQKLNKPRNKEFPLLIDVFKDFDVEYTTMQAWKIFGGRYPEVSMNLSGYQKARVLIKTEKHTYKLNPHSPLISAVDGFYRKREMEEQNSKNQS